MEPQARKLYTVTSRRSVGMCKWTHNEDICAWETDCKHTFTLENGGPTDNSMAYCCYCGRVLVQCRRVLVKMKKAGQE